MTIVTSGRRETVFDFFGLPRELRNDIYSRLTQVKYFSRYAEECKDPEEPPGTEAYIQAAPIPHVSTVCRQVKTENEEIFKEGFTLTFRDIGAVETRPIIKGDCSRITSAEMFLIAYCGAREYEHPNCGAKSDMRSHVDWIEKMGPKLTDLRDLRVAIYPCRKWQSEDKPEEAESLRHAPLQMQRELDRLFAVPGISALEVFPPLTFSGSGEAKDGSKRTRQTMSQRRYGRSSTGGSKPPAG